MYVLAILALSQQPSPKAVLDRYAAYRKQHPAVSVDWTLSNAGRPLAHGMIAIDGIKRMLFKSESGSDKYSLSETEKGLIEILPKDTTYDEFPAQTRTVMPPSRLGNEARAIPLVLMRTELYQDKTKFKSEASLTLDGRPTDVVSWVVTLNNVPFKFSVAVDSGGRILQMTREPAGGGGPGAGPMGGMGKALQAMPSQSSGARPDRKLVWRLSNYAPIGSPTVAMFYTPLPKGYVPFGLPATSAINIQVDDKFPAIGWKTADRIVDVETSAAGHPALVLITAPDSLPSQRALAEIGKIREAISGASVEAVSLARSASEAHGLPYDASGNGAQALGATSTPLFVLLDGKGKITNLWAGFDPDTESQFTKDVELAIKAQSPSK